MPLGHKSALCLVFTGNFTQDVPYLNFGDDAAPLRAVPSEGGQGSRQNDWTGPGEAAEVTAGDIVDLMPHDNGVHNEEA